MGKGDKDAVEVEEFPDLRVGPLDYSLSKIRTYLSPEQTEKLEEFRASIPTIWPETLTGVEEVFLTDATLCRYLRARDWNIGKASKMLVETLKWRREYKPWAITRQDIDGEMNNGGKMYRGGFDKHNRAILMMKVRTSKCLWFPEPSFSQFCCGILYPLSNNSFSRSSLAMTTLEVSSAKPRSSILSTVWRRLSERGTHGLFCSGHSLNVWRA